MASSALDTTKMSVSQFEMTAKDEHRVESFEGGVYITVILDESGSVWTAGYGSDGRSGQGDTSNRNKLTKVPNIPPMEHITCGGLGIIMKDRKGIMYATGYNGQGQLE